MIGFPYTYGDDLSSDKAKENQKVFLKKYGSVIIINSVLFILINNDNAQDNISTVPQKGVEAPSPVFKPILPPLRVIESEAWSAVGVMAIFWFFVNNYRLNIIFSFFGHL